MQRHQVHLQFPEERTIWSYGSGYGGNALLGKKCYSLRIASVMARDEGWLAEHMLILKLTSPEGVVNYIAAAFPSACGKTNLAMLEPTIPGWKVETLGDDIAWMRFGEDGRLYAVNPEYGLFGVAPGTGWQHQPQRDAHHRQGQLGLHQRRPHRRRRHLVGGHDRRAAGPPDRLEGPRLDAGLARSSSTPPEQPLLHADHPVPDPRAEYDDPRGVPISAILFGGRRKTTIPLVDRGPRLGARRLHGRDAVLRDHRRRDRRGRRGAPRPDGDAAVHRLQRRRLLQPLDRDGQAATTPPSCRKIFYVNWFRRDDDGGFLWPGFGENSRVLKWVIERLEGKAAAVETPIGHVPAPGALDVDGLDMTAERARAALAVDAEEWRAEIPQIKEWFDKFGDKLPTVLWTELDGLKARLGA